MSNWKRSFESTQAIARTNEALKLVEAYDTSKLELQNLEQYSRLLKALKFLKSRFENADPELFSQQFISNVSSPLANLQSYAQNLKTSGNTVALQHANSAVDQIFDYMRSADGAASPDALKAIIESAEAFQTKTIERLTQTSASVKALEDQNTALGKKITEQQGQLDSAKTVIEQQKSRLDQSISQFQKQFSDSEANRAKDFSAAIQKQNDSFNAEVAKFKQAHDANLTIHQERAKAHYEKLQDEAEKRIAWLNQKEDEVKRIFNVIGNVAVAGDYKNMADVERRAANWLRVASVVLMAAMITVAGFTFYHSIEHPEVDWRLFSFRLATSIILLIPAVYLAQESAKHRDREKKNRKLHLELAAIDAYLALQPEDKRNAIKAELTGKFFGQPEVESKDEEVSKHALFQLVSDIVKNLTKAK